MDETDKHVKPNPVVGANAFSKLFFCWLNPLFNIGYKRSLEESDMFNVVEADSSKFLTNRLEREWEKELSKLKEGKKASLLKALWRTFGRYYGLLGLVAAFEEGTKVVQPLLLGGLLRYFAIDGGVTRTEAYLYAAGISLCAILLALFHHPYFYEVQRVGMWSRIATCSLIYKKSLRISTAAMSKTTTGHIVNLLSNDVNRFDHAILFLHFLWVGPLQALAVLLILWYKVGPASLAGFGMLILLIPLQSSMGRVFSRLRRQTAVRTDERIRLMNEILSGIRVIKMYCWENMFADLVNKVRKHEIKCIKSSGYARASINAPFFSSAKLIAFITFLTYALSGNVLAAETVFVVIGMYNPVRLVMTLFVPFAVQQSTETKVTISRLEDFLLKEEKDMSSKVIHSPKRKPDEDCKVTAMNVTATWDKENNEVPTLTDISFEVRPGELLAVIGPVGAGKSSLLMALLEELPLISGSIKLNGKVAYASQQPWVFSASIRQNIVFGQDFDMTKYQRAIKAAALVRDLEILPDGDQTLIGERGASLSGGQKARVSLARTLYYDADIYLLDDPLSAVDTAVGRHIFEKCINGVLRSKPRILVTHQLQYLKMADKILILKEGEAMAMGTYDELAEGGVDFAALLKRDEDEEEEEEKPKINGHPPMLKLDDVILSDDVIHEDDKRPAHVISRSYDPKPFTMMDDNTDLTQSLLGKSKSSRSLYGPTERRALYHRSQASLSRSADSLSQHMGSMISLGTLDADIVGEYVAPVHEEERRKEGSVPTSLYLKYLYYGAGVFGILLLIILNLAAQVAYILCDWWLSYWSTHEEERQHAIIERDLELSQGYNVSNVTVPELDVHVYLYIYAGITVSVFVFGLLRALFIFYVLVSSARSLHDRMFASVVRSPILFFDTNPVGRILNRFSKDMGLVDENLPVTMFDFIQCTLNILAIILVAGFVNPWVFLPTTPLCILFVLIRRYFLATSRDIKRLEATTRSPVFTHVSASLQGLYTIRAFSADEKFISEFHKHQDLHSEAWSLFLSTSRWLAVRLDWLCAMFVTAVAMCSVIASENLNGGLVGLTLTYAIGLMGLFQWGVRQSAEVENMMTSVERLREYSQLPSEAPLESEAHKKPLPTWPVHGMITGEDAKFKYSKDGPYVLKGLNFCIRSQEKVGLVGRTGAGKSSLISLLFRLAEPEGTTKIDNIDIKTIGLHDLRKKISIIPQDPVLFTGSVRINLDPFSHFTDEDLWKALEEVQLKPAISELQEGLESLVAEGGSNFSVGQRQLVCLARALLRQNKILVIDEATANVDPRTDALIQQTIRQKFRDCTVLTIAHRLHTIMDSDRVMLLDNGQIVEFDEPYTLLQDDKSDFYSMVEQTGKAETERLLDIAKEAYLIRSQPNPDTIIPDSRRDELTFNVESKENGSIHVTSIV